MRCNEMFYWFTTGQKKASFHFHQDHELKRKWIYFMTRNDLLATVHSVTCISHFKEKFINVVKKVNSSAVASTSSTCNHNDWKYNPSLLRTPTIPRKSPRKRNTWLDDLVLFPDADKIIDIDSISTRDSPENITLKRLDNSLQLFNIKCIKETGILHTCISADRNLHVHLSYLGLVIPLPQWFRYQNKCTFTKFGMFENFLSYLRRNNKSDRSKWTF